MAEQSEGGKQELSKFSRRKFMGGVLGAAGAVLLEKAGLANAQTPTPDANAIKIADLETRIAEEGKKSAQETKIAELEKKLQIPTPTATKSATSTPTATAEPSKTPTQTATLTTTPTPDLAATATKTEAIDQAVVKELADRKAATQAREQAAKVREEQVVKEKTARIVAEEAKPKEEPESASNTESEDKTGEIPVTGGVVDAIGNLPTEAKVVGGVGVGAAVLAGADQLFTKGKGRGAIGKAGGGIASFAKKAPAGIWGFIRSKLPGGGGAAPGGGAAGGGAPAGGAGVPPP